MFAREPRRLPVVLSPEEVARLLAAAAGVKDKTVLSIAYGTGLRASEVISLKVGDIDSARMMIRVEQGKGHKDRYVMLSPQLLELLRQWWRIARPRYWLFPGQVPGEPLTTRQSTGLFMQRRNGRGLISAWGFTLCGTASPRICSNGRPTSASFRCCSGTRSSTPRRCILVSRLKTIREVTSPLDLAAHRR